MTSRSNLINLVVTLFFLGVVVFQTIYCYNRPKVSLDSFAYISLIESGDRTSFLQAGEVCSQILSGPLTGCDVVDSYPYHDVATYSPQDYATFLRFYRGKPIYLWSASIVHRGLGVSAYGTLRALSAFSYLVIAGISLFWISRYVRYSAACVLGALLISLPEVLGLGKVAVPDAMSTALFLIVVLVLLFSGVGEIWKLGLLALLSLTRTDYVIFSAIYGAVILYRSAMSTKTFVYRSCEFIGVLLVLQLVCGRLEHSLSYVTLFRHTFLAWAPPSAYAARLSVRDYVNVMRGIGLRAAVLNLPLPLLFAAIALPRTQGRPLRDLLYACLLTTLVRFLTFPSMEPRFYTWLLLVSAVAVIAALGDSFGRLEREQDYGNGLTEAA